ncbi:MAG: sigma-70 family RNA polymerase sigma factor [Lentisphaeria bacterium]|nr:sigma-70 family RNA polymerase sigma factor [Lentisphaeria bacterium]
MDAEQTTNRNADAMITRVSLIGKAKNQSDDCAWSEFVAYYRKYIYNIIRRMGLAHHDADEVVQLTLLKIWNAMPSFDYAPSKGRFRGWICRIAGNTAKNFLRDKGPVPMSLSSGEWDGEDLLDYSVEPEVEALAREEWERYLPELALKNISGKLDKKTIKVFTMFSNGISASDIAKRLELSENSVYVYKQRVIEKMTAEIARLKNEF